MNVRIANFHLPITNVPSSFVDVLQEEEGEESVTRGCNSFKIAYDIYTTASIIFSKQNCGYF